MLYNKRTKDLLLQNIDQITRGVMMGIVQVHRPLTMVNLSKDKGTPQNTGLWLIYDRDRLHMTLVPEYAMPLHAIKAMGDDDKGYFNAVWSSVVGWAINERVDNQPW